MRPFVLLSERERKFISAAAMHADLSVKELADKLKLREHVIRSIRQSLLTRKLITPLYMIDIYRLGFTDFRIFLSDISEPSRVRKAFERRILEYPQVYWLAKMNGAFQYAITFLAKEPCEMIDFFAEIQPPTDGFYAKRSVSIAGRWTVSAPTYLAPQISQRDSITLTARERVTDLDAKDHLILAAMAKNPSANTAALARATGLKENSLAYRIKRLTDIKVLRGQIYLLQCDALGILVYRVMIVERGLATDQREKLRRYIEGHPHVMTCLTCAGAWDYELRFETPSVDVLEDFCQTIVDNFGASIGSILLSQQVGILKRVSYPCK